MVASPEPEFGLVAACTRLMVTKSIWEKYDDFFFSFLLTMAKSKQNSSRIQRKNDFFAFFCDRNIYLAVPYSE